jgi:hypothetical protein
MDYKEYEASPITSSTQMSSYTFLRFTVFKPMRMWKPSHGSIIIILALEEMLAYKMVQSLRRK